MTKRFVVKFITYKNIFLIIFQLKTLLDDLNCNNSQNSYTLSKFEMKLQV